MKNIVAKSARLLGMLYHVDTKTTQLAVYTLIRLILEYESSAWDSYLETKDLKPNNHVYLSIAGSN